ncbi:MAG: PqiC family protein, partial [Candidatus Binataceae bacterium]
AQDLTQLLGTHSIIFYPWYGTTHVDYQVRIDVYRFETDPSDNAQLVAHWQVLDGSGKLLYANDSNLREHAQPGEPVAAALSRTVDGLARQISSAIQLLPHPGQA